MSVKIFLQQSPSNVYTNLDVIAGKVVLYLVREESFSGVTIKLECESRTRLSAPRRGARNERYESELEVHKLLYKMETVFPSAQLQNLAPGQKAAYTLPAGNHEWPFKFKIPFNNACAPVNSIMDRIQMTHDLNQHIKRPLPPSVSGFPGMCEIRYYVKATASRSSIFKENFRAEAPFKFIPIEPIRAVPNRRESYARRQHQFAALREQVPQSSGLFKKPPLAKSGGVPPIVSIDGRLPDPAIITCNRPIPLRVLVKKLNQTNESLFLCVFQILLVAHTRIRAHDLQRTEDTSFVIISKANFQQLIADGDTPSGKDFEIDASTWNHLPLPNAVCPTFETCNVSRWYELKINVGIQYGMKGMVKPELTIQELFMPCKVYSGIEPPTALLEEMFKRQSVGEPQISHPPSHFTDTVPQPGLTPQDPDAVPEYTPNAAPGAYVSGQAGAAAPPRLPGRRPTGPPGGPAAVGPDGVPDVPPPSYEDAMADDLAPVNGPRTNYEQPATAPIVSDEKRPSVFGR